MRVLAGIWVVSFLVSLFSVFTSPVNAATSVGLTIGVGDTIANITGQASPNAFVTIEDGGIVVSTVVADGTGSFSKVLTAQTPGIHSLTLYSRTSSGVLADSVQYNINFREHETTTLFAFLPSTVTLSGSSLSVGAELEVRGESIPASTARIYIDQDNPRHVLTDSTGLWRIRISQSQFRGGNHSIIVYVSDQNGQQSAPTTPRFFTVIAGSPLTLRPGTNFTGQFATPRTPTISTPKDGAIFTEGSITVVGTATSGAQIEVWRNNRLIGSVFAGPQGGWFMPVSLQAGLNEISARVCKNRLCSTFAPTTRVQYHPPEPQPNALRVILNKYRFESKVSERITLNTIISSGSPPFTFEVDWGDKSTKPVQISDKATSLSHVYASAGDFSGKLVVKDRTGALSESFFSVRVTGESSGPRNWILAIGAIILGLIFVRSRYLIEISRSNIHVVRRKQ